MKTLSDCTSALARTKHLLTDPEAGPCLEECAGTIEEALAFLGTLESGQPIPTDQYVRLGMLGGKLIVPK